MVYMSRMPAGGSEGHRRVAERQGDGSTRSSGIGGGSNAGQGMKAERAHDIGEEACEIGCLA